MRRAMSKKKVKDIERERETFLHGDPKRKIAGCLANGISEAVAQSIYDEIYDFANYAFNKAHAMSYAIVAYQTAWFKCHYTREYMAALLTSVLDSQDKVAEYIAECKDNGIALLPPDVNESGPAFTVSGDNIRFGLAALKGVGRGFVNALLAEREENGPFTSFPEFCSRMYDASDMNKRVVDSLIRSGCFDSMGYRRSQLLAVYEQVLDSIARDRRENLEGQFDLFSGQGSSGRIPEMILPNLDEFPRVELMRMEKEVTGLYLSGHPMDEYRKQVQKYNTVSIASILNASGEEDGRYGDGQRLNVAGVVSTARTKTTKNNSLMAYVTLEDASGSMELLVFSKVLTESGPYLKAGQPLVVSGRVSVRDEKAPQLMVDRVIPLGMQVARSQGNGQALWVRLPDGGKGFDWLKKLLGMFPGEDTAIVYLEDSRRRLRTQCLIHEALLAELREVLGKENVVLKDA